jgi:hypothetical protein
VVAVVSAVVGGLLLGVGGAQAATPPAVTAAATTGGGSQAYWEATSNGTVYGFGVANYGDLNRTPPARPIVGIANDGGTGYWLVGSDGGIFNFGSAGYYGSTGNIALNKPIVAMAATPDGLGYWLVASDGGVFAFGDAAFYGSTGNLRLNRPVVGITPTPDGRGYWLVASDGGIFAFGDAAFHGSTGNLTLNRPVVGMAAMPDGGGYDLIASDGGIFTFGDAPFEGSTGGITLNKPIVAGAATADGQGYWLAASDGGIFAFGDAGYEGSAGGSAISSPVVGLAATDAGNAYPAGATGYDVSWPQCTTPTSATVGALPPSGPVSIVGVNHGSTAFNSCFSQEAAWAGPNMSVYIFLSNETALSPADSYTTGVNEAAADVAHVAGLGYHPQIWWLDIEGPCGSSATYWQCGTSGQALNDDLIQGALSVLDGAGLTAGVYSTYLQWPEIVGAVPLEGRAEWIATVPSSTAQWAADCTALSFAGGTPYLVQWAGGDPATPVNGVRYDQDLACVN